MLKSSIFKGITAAVVTVSDSCSKGERQDLSGEVLVKLLKAGGAHVLRKEIVADNKGKVANTLKFISDVLRIKLILTTGGTGLSPRDLTPEATKSVIDKEAVGISELMRQAGGRNTQRAYLSRGICGVRGRSLIVNLPGSPKGATESFEAIASIIPHAFEMIKGEGH